MIYTNINTIVTIIAIIVGILTLTGITYLIKRNHKQSIKNSIVLGDAVAGDKNVFHAKTED